jgi:uroporphyrin-III C-methyltransferase
VIPNVKSVKNVRSAGKVWLIGAGPGDPELITLKAVRALGEADVVLVDDLVNRDLLAHAPRARVIEVGKRGGCKSTPQAFIEKLMVRLARNGKIVARLKGGDPFVFGRGGEEMLALRAAGVAHEVISGITAGIGAAASIGIPVTHRDCSRGVSFITGHTRENGREVAWAALARSDTTLVIYMGMGRLAEITAALIAGGMRADTPAAAVQRGTLASQREVIATLATLADAVRRAGLGSPAVVVIGDVVNLAAISTGTGTGAMALEQAA